MRQLAYHVLNLHPWSPFHLLLLHAMLGAVLVSTLIQFHCRPTVLPLRFHRRLVPGQGFAMMMTTRTHHQLFQLDARSCLVLLRFPRLGLNLVRPQRLQLISLHPPAMCLQPRQFNLTELTTFGQLCGTPSSQEISSPSELKRISSLMLQLSACLVPRARLQKSMMVRTGQNQHVNMLIARIVRCHARSS